MRKFVIVSDSCCELDENMRKQYGVDYIPMYVSYDGKSTYADLDWKELSAKEYYDILRNDTRIFTAQVTANDYTDRFEKYLKDGYDILSISCSSALSASVKASEFVRDELMQKYEGSEIVCIDSLNCSYGIGIMCMLASKLRSQGYTLKETAEKIENMKMNVNQFGTVDDLKFLKRAGRISTSKAVFGAMLGIKPIIISNQLGENVSTESTKGRINSMKRLAQLACETYTGEHIEGIFVAHGDCLEDAERVKSFILEQLPDVNVTIGMLNPIMGASCGPKTLSVYCVGQTKPVTNI